MKSKVFVLGGVFALVMAGSVFAGMMMEESAAVATETDTAAATDTGMAMEDVAAMDEGMGAGMMEETGMDNPVEGTEVGNKICPIEGGEIGKMGPAFKVAHNGKVYSLCCAACAKEFMKDPDGSAKKAEESVSAESAMAE